MNKHALKNGITVVTDDENRVDHLEVPEGTTFEPIQMVETSADGIVVANDE